MQHFNFTCKCPCPWPLQLHLNWDQPATLYLGLSCVFGSLWTTAQLNCVDTMGRKRTTYIQVPLSIRVLYTAVWTPLPHSQYMRIAKASKRTKEGGHSAKMWCTASVVQFKANPLTRTVECPGNILHGFTPCPPLKESGTRATICTRKQWGRRDNLSRHRCIIINSGHLVFSKLLCDKADFSKGMLSIIAWIRFCSHCRALKHDGQCKSINRVLINIQV